MGIILDYNEEVGKDLYYWSNSCGELHYHGERDLEPRELPEELAGLYMNFWKDTYRAYCYLAEYKGTYGLTLECLYSNDYSDSFDADYDALIERAHKAAEEIANVSLPITVFFSKDTEVWGNGHRESQLAVFVPYADTRDEFEFRFTRSLKLIEKKDLEIYEWISKKDHQTVVVINGRGGVGKDALIEEASKSFRIRNVSSIDPVKKVAKHCGWDGTKDYKARKFLSDLKRIMTEYNDAPLTYCVHAADLFRVSDDQFLFVHIREPQEIQRFKDAIPDRCVTLLVKRDGAGATGNISDDGVDGYDYDHIFDNTGVLDESGKRFCDLLKKIWEAGDE